METPNIPNPQQTVSYIISSWRILEQKWAKFRTKQLKAYRYITGNMLDDDTRAQLMADNRPIFEFEGILKESLLYIAGKLKRDATKFRAVPTSREGNEQLAMMHTVLNQWAMEGCSGYREIGKSAVDAAIGAFGWVNCFFSTRDNPEGVPVVNSIDPFLIIDDTESRMLDQSDCRYVAYAPMMSCEEIINTHRKHLDDATIAQLKTAAEAYEGKYDSMIHPRAWYERVWNSMSNLFNDTNERMRRDGLINYMVDARTGLYRTIEWHDRRTVTNKFVYSPDSRQHELIPPDKHNDEEYIEQTKARSSVDASGNMVPTYPNAMVHSTEHQVIYITVIVPALLPDKAIFEMPHPVQGRGFQFKKIPCYDFHPDPTQTRSFIDSQIAPIDLFNQQIMSGTQFLLDSLNPPIDAPDGSITQENKSSWETKKRGVIRGFKSILGMKPEPRYPQATSFEMIKSLAEMGREALDRSGVSPNARGLQESAGESGVLFQQRTAQTEVMISHFFDNVQEASKHIFSYLDRMMQVYMTMPREVRILQEPANPYWLPMNIQTLQGVKNDISQGDYEFRPDVEALGETARKEAVAVLAQVVPLTTADPLVQLKAAGLIYKHLDIPEGKEMAQFIEGRIQLAQGKEQMALQASIQQQQIAQTAAKVQMVSQVKQLQQPEQGAPAQ